MHREILNCPEGLFTDHIDMDRLNNQRYNLRVCTNADNQKNVPKRRNNTSGFKGVCWHKYSGKWSAEIQYNCKGKFLGLFTDKEQAALAYNEAAIEYHGSFAMLNVL